MKFKETLPNEDHLEPANEHDPAKKDGFVPLEKLPSDVDQPDEALMRKEEESPDYGHIEERMRQWEVKDRDADPTPQAWETHPAMEGVPHVATEQRTGGDVSDRAAAEEEDLDRKTLLEKLREWWGKDQNVSRNPSHVPKKDLPKGAQTIRGTDWTSPPADEAFPGAGDETRNAA